MNIDETIVQIEKLYQQATGQQIPTVESHHPIHPNMDPISLLEARYQELMGLLQDPTIQKQLQPWTPSLSVWENDEKIYIRVDLPGVAKEDVDLSVKNNVVIISGLRKNITLEAGLRPKLVETHFGHFLRTVMLPPEVVTAEINSIVKDGVLEITLQKQGVTRTNNKKNINGKSVQ